MSLLGMHDSYRGGHNLLALIILVLILSLVILLIVGLDRSNIGVIKISQQPLIDLQQKLILIP